MHGALHTAASGFLYGLAILIGTAIALPLLFFPLRWARAVGWRVPEDTDLVSYLARCLGAVVLAVVYVVLRAAPRPEAHLPLFELVALISALVALVHLWGALERRQPLFETVEIVFYAGVAAACWGFGWALGG